jgi:hypothetical protein
MSEGKLSELLAIGKDWTKVKTSIPGVFIVKLPVFKASPARLAVEINPVDASGNPTKRRGLLIRDIDEYEEFKAILANEKMESLMDMLEEINPKATGTSRSKMSNDIIEI